MAISLEEAFHGVTKTVTINGQNVNLKLKPGIADEQMLKLKGRGAPGVNGGPAGDMGAHFPTSHWRPSER